MKRILMLGAALAFGGLQLRPAVARPVAAPPVAAPDDSDAALQDLFDMADNEELDTSYGSWPTVGDGREDPMRVRAVQYLLRAHGYAVSVDGKYGRQTRDRVLKFQKASGVPGVDASGLVDDFTWEALVVKVKRNSTGAAVSGLQSLLRAQGYTTPLNGLFGPRTEAAVKAFQKKHGMKADGIAGGYTWCKLVGGTPYGG